MNRDRLSFKKKAIRFKVIHILTREFHVKCLANNRYRTHRFVIRAISVFQVNFNVEFTSEDMNFSIKEIYVIYIGKGFLH